jgi:hypothetical protein
VHRWALRTWSWAVFFLDVTMVHVIIRLVAASAQVFDLFCGAFDLRVLAGVEVACDVNVGRVVLEDGETGIAQELGGDIEGGVVGAPDRRAVVRGIVALQQIRGDLWKSRGSIPLGDGVCEPDVRSRPVRNSRDPLVREAIVGVEDLLYGTLYRKRNIEITDAGFRVFFDSKLWSGRGIEVLFDQRLRFGDVMGDAGVLAELRDVGGKRMSGRSA